MQVCPLHSPAESKINEKIKIELKKVRSERSAVHHLRPLSFSNLRCGSQSQWILEPHQTLHHTKANNAHFISAIPSLFNNIYFIITFGIMSHLSSLAFVCRQSFDCLFILHCLCAVLDVCVYVMFLSGWMLHWVICIVHAAGYGCCFVRECRKWFSALSCSASSTDMKRSEIMFYNILCSRKST